MIDKCYWERGTKHQWIFYANDNSSLDELSEKVNIDEIACSSDNVIVNLGIKKINGRLYSGNYVGVCRLKSLNGKTLLSSDGAEIILKIEPRFDISVVDMLNALRDDDEFERYLAPQTNRQNEAMREIEDLSDNELFHFFNNEDSIFLKDSIAQESSIITASVFITMLKSLCSRPLMGRMERKEENLTAKVKGKIVFGKNIQKNTLRGRDDRIYCRYLEYTEDIIENRILKAALHKAEIFLTKYFGSASGNNNSFRDMVSYCRNALSHISYTKIARLDLSDIKTTGVYVYYKPVINVAKMVLNEITLEATGNSAITSYVIPYAISMDKLFEMYIRAYLKRAGIKSYASKEKGLHLLKYDDKTAVLQQKAKAFSRYIAGNVKPDIVVYNDENGKYAVFDVKYKNSFNMQSSRSDRLQILAYALMFNCVDVGNIFPTQNGRKNTYYRRNKINSHEEMSRYYNQLNIAIDTNWEFVLQAEGESSSETIYEFFEKILK